MSSRHPADPLGRPSFWAVLMCACLAVAASAQAQTPQTILIDGVNDFDPSNLLDDDTADTQIQDWCTDDPEDDAPLDLGQIFVTNDTNNLYIGFEYDRDCFGSSPPQVNLGIAFSYGAEADGGNTDPFDRQIAWNTITRKPDNIFYVVLDGFNFEALYAWNGGTLSWDNVSGTINPGYGSGSDGLGMANETGFEELSLPLSFFGLTPGQDLHLEIWMTQDGTTKPPLDAMASDAVQTSVPGSTTFDVPTDVEMTAYKTYTIQSAVDNDPPVVARAVQVGEFAVDVTFNEPVDPTTAQTASNYQLVVPLAKGDLSPSFATLDGVNPNLVHLGFAAPISAANGSYRLSISFVEDLAGNAINDPDAACFAVKRILFRGEFGPYLATNSTPPDTFSVEGSKFPLSFGVCDDPSFMTDTGVDDIWEYATDFSFPLDCGTEAGSLVVEWKFVHQCSSFETIGNRSFTLNANSAALDTVGGFWDNNGPDSFTDKAIDVVLTLDTNRLSPPPTGPFTIGGDQSPLTFSKTTFPMVDDGTGQDAAAGDGIFTAVVTFPINTFKNVGYKFLDNAAFECPGWGNRTLFLDDTLFDTIGGINGPLVMPVAFLDRCFTVSRDVTTVFQVDVSNSTAVTGSASPLYEDAVIRLVGNQSPLGFDILTEGITMLDDGVAPDITADDDIYTTQVTFVDSTANNLEFKFAFDETFEGVGLPNRQVFIDDLFDAVGNPQILPVADLHIVQPTGVPTVGLASGLRFLSAIPNPFNPRTSITFEMTSKRRARLAVFDVRGRFVKTLSEDLYDVGTHRVEWDGRTENGAGAASGVYYVRDVIHDGGEALKMTLVK